MKYYRLELPKGTNEVLGRLKNEKGLKINELLLLAVDSAWSAPTYPIVKVLYLMMKQGTDNTVVSFKDDRLEDRANEKVVSFKEVGMSSKQRLLGAVLYIYLKENFSEEFEGVNDDTEV